MAELEHKETVLEEAQRHIYGDRNGAYGHPLPNFQLTVDLINARFADKLKTPFEAEDFAIIMILCKVARDANRYTRDNIVDIAGYAGCIQRIKDRKAGLE